MLRSSCVSVCQSAWPAPFRLAFLESLDALGVDDWSAWKPAEILGATIAARYLVDELRAKGIGFNEAVARVADQMGVPAGTIVNRLQTAKHSFRWPGDRVRDDDDD